MQFLGQLSILISWADDLEITENMWIIRRVAWACCQRFERGCSAEIRLKVMEILAMLLQINEINFFDIYNLVLQTIRLNVNYQDYEVQMKMLRLLEYLLCDKAFYSKEVLKLTKEIMLGEIAFLNENLNLAAELIAMLLYLKCVNFGSEFPVDQRKDILEKVTTLVESGYRSTFDWASLVADANFSNSDITVRTAALGLYKALLAQGYTPQGDVEIGKRLSEQLAQLHLECLCGSQV